MTGPADWQGFAEMIGGASSRASLVAFVSGVLNAWYFLLPPPDEHMARKQDR